jgi:hypothetical protein
LPARPIEVNAVTAATIKIDTMAITTNNSTNEKAPFLR